MKDEFRKNECFRGRGMYLMVNNDESSLSLSSLLFDSNDASVGGDVYLVC
jgi:hypothetical protein